MVLLVYCHCYYFSFHSRWTGTRYVRPERDSTQHVTQTSVSHINGITNLQFTRKRTTGDNQDVQFSDEASGCYHFFFPIGGGSVNNQQINRHSLTPVVSKKICITTNPQRCAPPAPSSKWKFEISSLLDYNCRPDGLKKKPVSVIGSV